MVNAIAANVPIEVKGYGTEELGDGNRSADSTREYFIGDICIVKAEVLYYEGRKDWNPAGFLMEGRLYKTVADLDATVALLAGQKLLEAWRS